MQKTLYILIGPKGSGKTHIGSRIEELRSIKFLRVEPLWLQLAEGEDGWSRVEREIDQSGGRLGQVPEASPKPG